MRNIHLKSIVRFGVFELDLRIGELRKQGLRIRLQEQPFQVLELLTERPGEVVTREELQKRIWPSNTFVGFDHGLYNAVKKLREALGDAAETPRFIETVPRRGYRFVASVVRNEGAQPDDAVLPSRMDVPLRRWHSYARIAIAAGVVLVLIGLLSWADTGHLRQRLLAKFRPPVIRSIAVLPLANLSNDADQEYFSDGMTDELITDLAQRLVRLFEPHDGRARDHPSRTRFEPGL